MATLIKIFDVSRLRQEEARTFHEMFSGITAQCTHEVVQPYQSAYVAKLDAYKNALRPDMKSQITADMTALDAERGHHFVNYRAYLRSLTFHYEKYKAAIAQTAYDIVRKYGDVNMLPYLDESGSIDDMIEDLLNYNNEDLTKEPSIDYNRLAVIDALGWAGEIKRVNDLFKDAFLKRLQEQSGAVAGQTSATRKALDASHGDVVRKFNAIIEVFGDEEYRDIVAQLNDLIDYQNAIIKARTGKSATANGGTKPDGGTTPEDPTTPEDNTNPDEDTTPDTPDTNPETPEGGDEGTDEGEGTDPTPPEDDDEEVVG